VKTLKEPMLGLRVAALRSPYQVALFALGQGRAIDAALD
jgi:hypothetical protein